MIIKMDLKAKLFIVWIVSLGIGWGTRPYIDGYFAWWGDVLFCLMLGIIGAVICVLIEKIPDTKDG